MDVTMKAELINYLAANKPLMWVMQSTYRLKLRIDVMDEQNDPAAHELMNELIDVRENLMMTVISVMGVDLKWELVGNQDLAYEVFEVMDALEFDLVEVKEGVYKPVLKS